MSAPTQGRRTAGAELASRTERAPARLARLLRAQLDARGERGRPLTLLALGGDARATEDELGAEDLGSIQVVSAAVDARFLARDLADPAFRRTLPRVDVLFLEGLLEELAAAVAALRDLADRTRYLLFTYDQPARGEDVAARLAEIEVRILARSLGGDLAREERRSSPAYLVRSAA